MEKKRLAYAFESGYITALNRILAGGEVADLIKGAKKEGETYAETISPPTKRPKL